MKRHGNIVVESFIDDYAKLLATETVKLITSSGREKGIERDLVIRFLHYYTHGVLLESLNRYTDKPLLDKKEQYTHTRASYLTAKSDIQLAISTAFEKAFYTYAKQKPEYYCLISLVPEAINKQAC